MHVLAGPVKTFFPVAFHGGFAGRGKISTSWPKVCVGVPLLSLHKLPCHQLTPFLPTYFHALAMSLVVFLQNVRSSTSMCSKEEEGPNNPSFNPHRYVGEIVALTS